MPSTSLNDAPPLPIAQQVAASYREPRPKRTVIGKAYPAAAHDQPGKSLLHSVKRHVFARALLLEVADETQRIAVVHQPCRLRVTPKGIEQVAVTRAFSDHHLQTNTPPDLGQPTPSGWRSAEPMLRNTL
jgi:hypothetical protein